MSSYLSGLIRKDNQAIQVCFLCFRKRYTAFGVFLRSNIWVFFVCMGWKGWKCFLCVIQMST